jgi:hypothetical protein
VHRALQSRETSPPGSERLDSWKEIAAYLGRQVRTLHLWEKAEKLPVHRHIHSKRGTVYAFKSELDAWKQARTLLYANRNKGVQGRAGTAAKEMVGVLPFENLSGDASQEYLGDASGSTRAMSSRSWLSCVKICRFSSLDSMKYRK